MTLEKNRLHKMVYILVILLAVNLSLGSILAQGNENTDPLTERVRQALVNLPYYTVFDILSVRIEGTKAILEGEITNPTLKSAAEARVKKVSDIEEVENNIKVLPFSPNDDRIRLDVYRAIYYHPDFTRYATRALPPIHIIVNNGDVRLEGAVGSSGDKTLAGVRANGVPGVFSVKNNLQVIRN